MKLIKRFLLLTVPFWALTFFNAQVFAHTHLQSSIPAAGAKLEKSPQNLMLTFSQPVRLMSVELYRGEAQKIELAFQLSPLTSPYFEIPLSDLKADSYTVKWIAMGKDSHKIKGEFLFFIMSESMAPVDAKVDE